MYKTVILPVVLHGCETWSLILREERRLRVSENVVLRKMFERKREKVAGGWGRLHNEEPHNLYTPPNVIRAIKSRRIGWVGRVACKGEMINAYNIFVEKSEGKDRLEDLGVRWRIILEWILGKYGWKLWAGFMLLRIETAGSCEHGFH
jgi:hypothetical protein